MFVSGAIAGLVGAIIVLGSQFRFIDGGLLTPAYTWSGLMAALLVNGEPAGAILAACSSPRCKPAASPCSARPPSRAS